MTDAMTPPQPNHTFAKGLALGMGVLLLGGTALLITLIVTQSPDTPTSDISAVELQAGEKVIDVSVLDGEGIFLIENTQGEQRVLLVNLTTGARREIDILAQ